MRAHSVGRIALALAGILIACGLAAAQTQSLTTVEGTVASATPTSAVVTTTTGKAAVTLTDHTRVTRRLSATLADIKPGMFIAVTASKGASGTLTAVVINIIESLKATARHGQWPMETGNIMTNETVTSIVSGKNGRTIKLVYQDQTASILVPDNTPIHRIEMAKTSDLKAGEHVTVRGAAAPNGGVTAAFITIE